MTKKYSGYDPAVELAKGAELTAASYDKTQGIIISVGKVTVGGKPGVAEISGLATGKQDAGIDGTIDLWLSIFRYYSGSYGPCRLLRELLQFLSD